MNRPREPRMTEPEARPVSPWLEAALRAKDPNAFLMGLGETEFAVLLAELDVRHLPMSTLNVSERTRRKQNQSPASVLTAPSGHGDDTARQEMP